MPLTPPKALQSLLVGDSATSRALQNVKSAVDPLLGLVNTTFQVANDGSLGFLRRVKTFAVDNLTAGAAVVNGALGVKGDAVIAGKQTVVGPIVNVGGVQSSGPVSGTNVVSTAGFKCDRDMGYAWVSSAAAGTRYQAKKFTQNNEATSTYAALVLFQPSFSGSVVGVHGYSLGTAGGTYQIQLFKSATTVPATGTPWLQTNAAGAAQYVGATQVFSKGLYPFVANDYFCCSVTWTTGGNQHVQIQLTLEYGA